MRRTATGATKKTADAAPPAAAAAAASAPVEPLLSGRVAIGVCAALLAGFVLIAWLAVRGKSATYDEPLHVTAAWEVANRREFRVDPEDPCLWQYWAALPQPSSAFHSESGPLWSHALSNVKWPWTTVTLYDTPGLDADAFLARSRAMMLVLAVALGAAIATWAGQIAGGAAAVVAAALFAIDPNFLAHAPLVKNDVTIALVMFAMVWAAWHCGRRLTWPAAAAVVLCAAAGPAVKFSGNALVPFLAAILLARALLPGPWRCLRRDVRTTGGKVGVAAGLCATAALTSWLLIWACYGFRFSVSPEPGAPMDFPAMLAQTALNDLGARHPEREPTPAEAAAWVPPPLVKGILWARDHRALPEAWLYGLLETYCGSRVRRSFLCGRTSIVGFPMYFPLAFIFKTPLATQVSMVLAALVGVGAITLKRRGAASAPAARPRKPSVDPASTADTWRWETLWIALCLALPVLMYGGSAVRSNLNLGLRHLFPIYPYLYVSVGLAAAVALERWRRVARLIIAGLAVALAGETLLAFPDYIPFFNAACGGSRGGLGLLSDSNLDWGQDLKLVAAWQREHPDVKLYLAYFGKADPRYYGIRFTNMPAGFAGYNVRDGQLVAPPKPTSRPNAPGVLAISATILQGTYESGTEQDIYGPLRRSTPLAVLGGSIYLFEVNVVAPPQASETTAPANAPAAPPSSRP
jgi:hypothetical protein